MGFPKLKDFVGASWYATWGPVAAFSLVVLVSVILLARHVSAVTGFCMEGAPFVPQDHCYTYGDKMALSVALVYFYAKVLPSVASGLWFILLMSSNSTS